MQKLHLVKHRHAISKQVRQQQKGHRSPVVWFTGLSGSGKSTLAGLLEQQLVANQLHTYLLDGDNVRLGLNNDLSFSAADRKENIRRIAEVARLFADAGLVTITAFISPFAAERALARRLAGEGNFVEVFIDCPVEVCAQRDVKGLYAKAKAGIIKDFTGVNSPFEAPEQPEIHLKTADRTTEECVQELLHKLRPYLELPNTPLV
jgi:adenylylsulfate kinase